MLIELTVGNFRSIRSEQTLSLVAGAGKELERGNVAAIEPKHGGKSLRLLRSAALYGPNAGGKSNFIKALATMRGLVLRSHQELGTLPADPFAFDQDSRASPCLFEVVVILDGVRYQYGFEVTVERVHSEWLYAFPHGRAQRWFERSPQGKSHVYQFSPRFHGDRSVWQRATRPDALFLSTAVQFNSELLKPLFEWFRKTRILGVGGLPPAASIDYLRGQGGDELLDFLRAADLGIADLRVEEEDFDPGQLPASLPSPLRTVLEEQLAGQRQYRVRTGHRTSQGELVDLDLGEESDGTQKMFHLAGHWLGALASGALVAVDELHDNLHPKLARYLVERFNDSEANRTGAQLIFTSHETAMLSQELFRRDQIWFCERGEDQGTILYPLTDFSPRKGVENLERAYLGGRYGALPVVTGFPKRWAAG